MSTAVNSRTWVINLKLHDTVVERENPASTEQWLVRLAGFFFGKTATGVK